MAKRGGFPGGAMPGNMANLMKQAQKMQRQMEENQKALEEKRQMEQMPKGSIHERLAWGARKSEMENQQRKKNKTKNRGMER